MYLGGGAGYQWEDKQNLKQVLKEKQMTWVRGARVSRNACMSEMWCVSEEGDDEGGYKCHHLLRANYVSDPAPGTSHVSSH